MVELKSCMTHRQFWIHLLSWLRTFPNPFAKDETIPHVYISDYGEIHHICWICGRTWDEPRDND